ncbi:MAG: sulfur carrier protein ThiS [Campylobacterales bacterium]|nr:sulfur carrier protein ThiS [Campylobacterales bacterium]
MQIIINGETRNVADHCTISELIETLGIKVKVMAAAVNMEIVKKEAWDTHQIKEGDKLELLHFVGGG